MSTKLHNFLYMFLDIPFVLIELVQGSLFFHFGSALRGLYWLGCLGEIFVALCKRMASTAMESNMVRLVKTRRKTEKASRSVGVSIVEDC